VLFVCWLPCGVVIQLTFHIAFYINHYDLGKVNLVGGQVLWASLRVVLRSTQQAEHCLPSHIRRDSAVHNDWRTSLNLVCKSLVFCFGKCL